MISAIFMLFIAWICVVSFKVLSVPPDKRRNIRAFFYIDEGKIRKTDKTMNKTCKIKIYSFITQDGFMSGMNGDIDWLLEYPRLNDEDYGFHEFRDSVDCIVMNGMFYALLQSRDLWSFGDTKCHIITPQTFNIATIDKATYVHICPQKGHGIIETIMELRDSNNRDIWLVGDHEIISLCMEHSLIDEMILNVVPVFIYNGKSLFAQSGLEQLWRLEHRNWYDNGVIQMRYTVNSAL